MRHKCLSSYRPVSHVPCRPVTVYILSHTGQPRRGASVEQRGADFVAEFDLWPRRSDSGAITMCNVEKAVPSWSSVTWACLLFFFFLYLIPRPPARLFLSFFLIIWVFCALRPTALITVRVQMRGSWIGMNTSGWIDYIAYPLCLVYTCTYRVSAMDWLHYNLAIKSSFLQNHEIPFSWISSLVSFVFVLLTLNPFSLKGKWFGV